jgi:hypothetical protein
MYTPIRESTRVLCSQKAHESARREEGGRSTMGSPNVPLSYYALQEVLAQIAPHYQAATDAQKLLLLDQVVKVTGYARK